MAHDDIFLLKIFIYNKKGELIKEYLYNEAINVLNEIIDHNIEQEDDQWNAINGFEFPPMGLTWNVKDQEWKQIKIKDFFRLI
jgi:hypothetical protein